MLRVYGESVQTLIRIQSHLWWIRKKNYSQERGVVSFKLEELDGVPPGIVKGYNKRLDGETELYDVTFRVPDIIPIVRIDCYG